VLTDLCWLQGLYFHPELLAWPRLAPIYISEPIANGETELCDYVLDHGSKYSTFVKLYIWEDNS